MGTDKYRADVEAIQALIARQFGSLCWAPGKQAAWEVFTADFHPDASLYPAGRPAQCQTVPAFVARMQGLAATRLRSFEEAVLGTEVHEPRRRSPAPDQRCGGVANRVAGVGQGERVQANSCALRRR
jgi:hypothetical protein